MKVDSRTQVPLEYVKNGEITLNISPNAVHKLQMGNELIEFSARFGGVARQIAVPVANVYALYARETGHGMTFDVDGPKAGRAVQGRIRAGARAQASRAQAPCTAPRARRHLARAAEETFRRQAHPAPDQVACSGDNPRAVPV